MDVRVCKNCRRLFNYVYGPDLCPECSRLALEIRQEPKGNLLSNTAIPLNSEDEIKYEQVKEFIVNNPKVTVAQIAEALQISPSKLYEWIKDERLEFSDDSSSVWFTCEKCGIKIKSGRLCNRCKGK